MPIMRKRYRGPVGVARARPGRFASRILRRIASPGLSRALSRVHMFKRVGTPLYIANNNLAGFVTDGNVDMVPAASMAYAAGILAQTGQVRGALRFCLNQASQVADITGLFDNYRITRVSLHFMFTVNSAPGGATTGFGGATPVNFGSLPVINYCYDPDDNTVPANREEVLANGFAKTRRLDSNFTVSITPRGQNSIVGGVGGAGGLMPVGQWLDSASPQIYHYGLKFCIDNWPQLPASADKTIGLVITPTFYIEGKNVV